MFPLQCLILVILVSESSYSFPLPKATRKTILIKKKTPHLFILCSQAPQCRQVDQRTTLWSCFSPLATEAPGISVRSPGLVSIASLRETFLKSIMVFVVQMGSAYTT